MVAIKIIGLIATIYVFAVLEVFGQNFYPARYGKREDNGESSYQSKSFSENKRIGRSENPDGLNRKMGFFISSGRFGKKRCTENCFEGSKEILSGVFQNRQDRSERIRIPIRKNQFMIGSRFGKRMEGSDGVIDPGLSVNTPNFKCVFLGIGNILKCLETRPLTNEEDTMESNSNGEFPQ